MNLKGFAVAAALVIAAVALAAKHGAMAVEVQPDTRTVPTSDTPLATEQIKLEPVKKMRLSICSCSTSACTATGQILDGGSVELWYNHPTLGWILNPDYSKTIDKPGQVCRTWADIETPGGNVGGAMMARTNAAGVLNADGGNYFKVVLEGMTNE